MKTKMLTAFVLFSMSSCGSTSPDVAKTTASSSGTTENSAAPSPSAANTPTKPNKNSGVPAPSVPAPSVPAPSVPAPSVPAPSVPAPSVPAPSLGFLKFNLNDDDSSSAFDSLLNSGTTNPLLDINNPSSTGHWRVSYSDPTDAQKTLTLAYFLSSDGAFRFQCVAETGPFGSSGAKCFLEIDPSKSQQNKTNFTNGKYKNSVKIIFSNSNDVDAISGALTGVGPYYFTSEEVGVKGSDDKISKKALLQIDCGAPIGQSSTSCEALINPRSVSVEN